MVTPRRRNEPTLTVGDRLVTAMMGFVLAFLTMALVWLMALRFFGDGPEAPLLFRGAGSLG